MINESYNVDPFLLNENKKPPALPPRRKYLKRNESEETLQPSQSLVKNRKISFRPSKISKSSESSESSDSPNLQESQKISEIQKETKRINDFINFIENNEEKIDVEPLFTVNISIKNERSGVTSKRKLFI
jgi:hypothetical protein